MSLVGTRPPTVDEWDKYELHHRARLATKPGLTGMWQVSGRSNITDLSVVLIWNENDQKSAGKYIKYVTKMLTYDVRRPFSRTINLPIFYYSNFEDNKVPPLPKLKSKKILIYVFIGM